MTSETPHRVTALELRIGSIAVRLRREPTSGRHTHSAAQRSRHTEPAWQIAGAR